MHTIPTLHISGPWKKVLKGIAILASLPFLYFLVYVVLSLCGRYRPMSESDLDHFEIYSMWAPLGFYDPHPPPGSVGPNRGGGWRFNVVMIFYPLWLADNTYVHKRHDDCGMDGWIIG